CLRTRSGVSPVTRRRRNWLELRAAGAGTPVAFRRGMLGPTVVALLLTGTWMPVAVPADAVVAAVAPAARPPGEAFAADAAAALRAGGELRAIEVQDRGD